MKALNWAKEKLGKMFGVPLEQRFNKVHEVAVIPPDRKRRSAVRKQYQYRRWITIPTLRGCPRLSGLRLLRTASNCTGIRLKVLQAATEEERRQLIAQVYVQKTS